jgi:hypothetical protein
MLQTVTPLAVKHNLSVNSRFAATAAATVAADVRKRKGVVLTVWDHSHIPALAAALGVRQPPAWDGHDFDSIWVIRYASGKAEMTVDAEGIAPSAQCTF